MFRRPLSTIVMAAVVATIAAAATAPPARAQVATLEADSDALRDQRRDRRKAERAARRFSRRNPEVWGSLIPPEADLSPGTRSAQMAGDLGPVDVVLDSLRQAVLQIGHRELEARDRDQLGRLYSGLYEILPVAFRAGLADPSTVVLGSRRAIAKQVLLLGDRIRNEFDGIRGQITGTASIPGLIGNPIDDCTAEIGAESVGVDDESSDRCLPIEYAAAGIMGNLDFVLKDDLTCIRNQGSRGTCVAHTVLANVETTIQALGGVPENLSEQNLNFWGKIVTDYDGRYIDGIVPEELYDALDAENYRLQYEENWNYNQSPGRGALNGANQFPGSCGAGYTGEMCTDYSFQGQEIAVIPGLLVAHDYPAPEPGGWEITDWLEIPDLAWFGQPEFQLDGVILFLENEVPIHIGLSVPNAFLAPDANGYVNHNPGDTAVGAHSALAVGWVENADLPAGVPTDPDGRGYAVVKNSWGTAYGDCGFAYLSHDFLQRWAYAYRILQGPLQGP